MSVEVTAKNTGLIEQIRLHDVLLESIIWELESDSISFKMSNWEWNNEGKLTLYGIVYCEASALGLYCSLKGGPYYINHVYVDDQFSITDLLNRYAKVNRIRFEDCNIPNVDNYFCVAMFLATGDFMKFVVEKLIWEPTSDKQEANTGDSSLY